MTIKKNYFPSSKAPDIAKKIVMQYIYWNKPHLSKRFYFYRVYAPAFLLLFVVWWWLTYYNKINKPHWEMYTFRNNSWIISKFIKNTDIYQNALSTSETAMINNNTINNSIANNDIANNVVVTDNTANNANIDSMMMKWSQGTNPVNSVNAVAVNNSQQILNQQISEIEALMNDISSITSQEEILF